MRSKKSPTAKLAAYRKIFAFLFKKKMFCLVLVFTLVWLAVVVFTGFRRFFFLNFDMCVLTFSAV